MLPRKEYKTITIKVETFQRFLKALHNAKKIIQKSITASLLMNLSVRRTENYFFIS
jgi:hypothetical protein